MECIWLDGIRDQLDWLNKNEKKLLRPLVWVGGEVRAQTIISKFLIHNSKLYDCYCKQKIKT